VAEIFINQGYYLQKVIKYASVSSSTWYSRKQHVKEDKRKNNPGRPVPGYTINPNGSIILDELIVSALEQYRQKKKEETQDKKKYKQADYRPPSNVGAGFKLWVYPWRKQVFYILAISDVFMRLIVNYYIGLRCTGKDLVLAMLIPCRG